MFDEESGRVWEDELTVDRDEMMNTMRLILKKKYSLMVKNKHLMENGSQEDIYTHPPFQLNTLNIEQVPILSATFLGTRYFDAIPTSQVRQE